MPASKPVVHGYVPSEEIANAITHGVGTLAAIAASVWILTKGNPVLNAQQMFGLAVYCASLVLLFLSSTLYHSIGNPKAKDVFKRMDHCAIYLLIAGSYTPMLMLTLQTRSAEIMLWVVWTLAAVGVVFKTFFVHRFKRVSLIAYLLMGWLSIFLINDLWLAMDRNGFWLMLAGGLCFTVGAAFYAAKKIRYTHAIWHVFVAAGAACHAVVIGVYVVAPV